MKKAIKRIWNFIATILVLVVVVLAILLAGVKLIGLDPYIVQSGSMEPEYPTGSILYIKETDVASLKEWDVITFRLTENTIATHRIVEIVEENGKTMYRTKGDANESEDAALVAQEQVIGTPVFAIPGLGYFVAYLQSTKGTYTAISAGAVLMLLLLLPDLLFGEDGAKKKKAVVEPESPPEEMAEPQPQNEEVILGDIPEMNGGDL